MSNQRSRAAGIIATITGLAALGLPLLTMASDAAFEQLIEELDSIRTEYDVAGFALTRVTGEGRRSGAGGLADRASGRPVTEDTLFRIGSITKTFNALAVMMLVEQDRLLLETPVRNIVVDAVLDNPWAESRPVRVAHLLEQSSGLLDISREEFDHNEPFPTLEAAFAWRPKVRVVQWPPGLHHVYSNANAGLAGLVIERASGKAYTTFITERLLRPLGMHSAGLVDDAATRERLATGYDTDGRTPIPYWHMIFPPLGAINAAPREMGALVELFLRRGRVGNSRLLDPASIERMEQPKTTLAARRGLSYGYGPGLRQYLHNGSLWYGHGGDGDGYLSRFEYSPQADAGYFLAINAFNYDALEAMVERVRDHLARGLSAPPQPAPAVIAAEKLVPLTGTYVAATRRFEWQTREQMDADRLAVVLDDGALYTQTETGRRELIPVDAHRFRRDGQPMATISISPYDQDIYLQAEFGNYRRLRAGE